MRPGDTITTERLHLRHWDKARDGAAFHRLNSDPQVMRFFAYQRSREEADAFMDQLAVRLETEGLAMCAITRRDTGAVIGWGGVANVPPDLPAAPAVEIGWRLLPEEWGKGFATEAAASSRDYAFETLGLEELVAFAVPTNHASTAVMKRIGMRHGPARDFLHPRVPEDRPDIRPHVFYHMTYADWLARNENGG